MKKDALARGAASAQFAGGFGETDVTRNLYKGTDVEETTVAPVDAPKKPQHIFRPLGDVILVRRKVADDMSAIIITETIEKDKPAEGTVLAVGPSVYSVGVDEHVVFGKYAGAEFVLNGESLLLMEIREVLGTIETIETGEI